MTGVRGRCLLVVMLGVGLFMGWQAGSARRASAAGTEEAAQQAFREGVEAARQSRWEEARALFEQAYALSPRPVVLINLAGAQARTGRLTEAAKNYRRIVDDVTSNDTASFRRAAADVLPELEQRVPRIRVRPTGHTEADSFRLDETDLPADKLTEEIPLDPGSHTLVVSRGGVERARVLFSLAEREQREIALALPTVALLPRVALDPAAQLPAQQTPGIDLEARGPASSEGRAPTGHWWSSPWTWGVVGVVVIAATSAVALYTYEHRDMGYSGNVPPGQIKVR